MRSIVTVSTPASETDLTTLARVKLELGLTNNEHDEILTIKIAEASSDCEAALGFRVARETVVETFWPQAADCAPEYLALNRTPVSGIASVVLDDAAVASSLYRLDAETGLLYSLDSSGYASVWIACKSIVLTYTGGYLLPDNTGRNLPKGIEGACVDLVQCYWFWRGRDPSLKSEEAPGIMRYDYWVGAVGDPGQLPPSVLAKLAPYRRAAV